MNDLVLLIKSMVLISLPNSWAFLIKLFWKWCVGKLFEGGWSELDQEKKLKNGELEEKMGPNGLPCNQMVICEETGEVIFYEYFKRFRDPRGPSEDCQMSSIYWFLRVVHNI